MNNTDLSNNYKDFELTPFERELLGAYRPQRLAAIATEGVERYKYYRPFRGNFYMTQAPHSGHWAIDWGMPNGTKLYCPFPSGVVSFTGFTSDGYAYNLRIVDEVQGLMCVLAHMPKTNPFLVSVGQKVTFETPVGYSNNTGNSTGPHLHFEIRKKPWAYVDCYRDILIDLDLLPTTPPPPPPPTNNPVLVKTTQPCKVYTSPSKTSPMLKRLSKAGISLMVTDVDGEWAKIVCGEIIDHGYIRWTMLDSQP